MTHIWKQEMTHCTHCIRSNVCGQVSVHVHMTNAATVDFSFVFKGEEGFFLLFKSSTFVTIVSFTFSQLADNWASVFTSNSWIKSKEQ